MTTKFIAIKDFRQNIAKYAEAARAKADTERFIVMNRTTPLFEVRPFPKNTGLTALVEDILEAKKDVAEGRVYSHEAVLAQLQ